MEMSIDEAMEEIIKFKRTRYKDDNVSDFSQALSIAFLTMKNYQILKNSYNDRLKADLVAMLKELDLEVDELANHFADGKIVYRYQLHKLIQQKINSLKSQSEPQESEG